MKCHGKFGAIVTLSFLMYGCLVLPVPMKSPGDGSRTNITKKQVEKFVAGETALEDVVSAFGEPDQIINDGREIIYDWSKNRWGIFWLVAAVGPTGGDAAAGIFRFGDDHQLRFYFDEDFKLVEHSKSKNRKYKGHKSLD